MRSSVSFPLGANNGEIDAGANMQPATDVVAAAYLMAHNFRGGVRALAEEMGVSANTLQNKLNPCNTTHHITLKESVLMQLTAKDPGILRAMAAALGYSCAPAIPDLSGGDPVEAFMFFQREVGEFTSSVADALEGGQAVSRNELKRIQYHANELTVAVAHMVATVADRTPSGKVG